MSLNYNITKSNNNYKKNKSLSNNYFFNNKSSKLHSFITTKNKYDDFELTIVPYKTILYQGTDFNFEGNKKSINDYYNYYNKRHNGAYFLSSYKVASLYGINKDFSNIIYTTIPDKNEIIKTVNTYEYIYPLYYIKGNRGVNIKYTLNKNLILINIGNINNVRKLWNIIKSLNIDDNDKKEEYLDTIFNTCGVYEKSNGYLKPPTIAKRISNDDSDDELVKLFINIFKPYFKLNYKLDIDGWIYYSKNEDNFHDEILIIDNKSLIFKDMKKLPSTLYKGLLSYEEFKKKMEPLKIKNNSSIKKNTVLSNYCIVKYK